MSTRKPTDKIRATRPAGSSEVRSPTSTSTEVRSPTSTSTEVRSPTSTSTEVRSPTSTSTDAYTQGNVTVTGGAGAGATTVHIYGSHPEQSKRADEAAHAARSRGMATRPENLMRATGAPRPASVPTALMRATGASRPSPMNLMRETGASRPAPPRQNPTADTKRAAIGKFREFWRQEPTKIGEFPSSFKIPTRAHKLGRAMNVLYESLKTDPETLKKPKRPISYIHEIDYGVQITDLLGAMDVDVPAFISEAQALVCLGRCVGFAWRDGDGAEHEAEGTDPLPDLWCTVDGRALLIVQSRRKVLQIIWGGGLGVEARGIVG